MRVLVSALLSLKVSGSGAALWVSGRAAFLLWCSFWFSAADTPLRGSKYFVGAAGGGCNVTTASQQGAAPDHLQLRSFLAPLPAAGELGRCAVARGVDETETNRIQSECMHTNIDDISFVVNQPLSNDDLNVLFASAWRWQQHRSYDFQPMLERSLAYTCAFHTGCLVGFVNLAWDGGVHAFISEAAVHQDFQKHGIGSQLVRQAVDVARQKKLEWVHVDYEPHLQHFYQKCGFGRTDAGVIRLE